MALNDLVQPVAAAVTSQVKLCPYDEEEPHIWFQLIEAQFAAAGIRAQKLKYANALPNLPKQVLRDILDILDVCNESDHPFDLLKTVLLGQFGKSKWQSYFELPLLPMDMQGLKPSILMGETQPTPASWSFSRHRSFHGHVSHLPTTIHERSGRHRKPQDSCRHGSSCGRLVVCSRRPRPYGRGCHNSQK